MSKKSNPTLIGAFVVGAVVLLAAGIAIFGGSELLARRVIFVSYFVEDTQGLRVGSNVALNGVRVGHVSRVALLADIDSFETKTEVTIEILPDSFVITRNGVAMGRDFVSSVSHDQLVEVGGMRASLAIESFITGQLLLELDTRPETEIVWRGGPDPPFPEIPTIPSRSQELLAKARAFVGDLGEGFDVKQIGQYLEHALKGVDELANSRDLRDSLAGLNSIINKTETQELTVTLQASLDEIRSAAGDASILLRNADTKLGSLTPVIEKMVVALDEAQATLAAAKSVFRGESAEVYQLGTALSEVEGAARALREFLDYLERNPETLLRGKRQ
ncbi:MAG: MlaD family protein [Woeseiaceae bacterium]